MKILTGQNVRGKGEYKFKVYLVAQGPRAEQVALLQVDKELRIIRPAKQPYRND